MSAVFQNGTASTQNPFASGGGAILPPLLKISPVVNPVSGTSFTVSTAQSGTTFVLPSGAVGAATITLPTPATSKGCSFKFIMGVNGATNPWTITGTSLNGTLLTWTGNAAVARVVLAGGANVPFSILALAGDWIEFFSTGTTYAIQGSGGAASFT